MRVLISPTKLDIVPGQQVPLTITITNTATVIGGYTIRILGADPQWVGLEHDSISLFPDETRTLVATLSVPAGLQAGTRRIAVQVRELTPPEDTVIQDIDLTVPAARAVSILADPLVVTGGRQVGYSLIAENSGNTVIDARLGGDDPERKVGFLFEPPIVHLVPGEHAVIDMQVRAHRKLLGQPVVRSLSVYLDDVDDAEVLGEQPAPPGPSTKRKSTAEDPPARDERKAVAQATFIQKSYIGKGVMALLGLLVAVSVFATVITVAMSNLAGTTKADRDLALQVIAAQQSGAPAASSSMSGTVKLLTSGNPVAGVSVSVFKSDDLTTAVATTATDKSGAWTAAQLAAGQYKVSFRGAGFVELWYPNASNPDDASTVTLDAGAKKTGVNASLGGVPGTITGKVGGSDVSGATLYLEAAPKNSGPSTTAAHLGTARAANAPASQPGTAVGPDGLAVVQQVPIASDGTFTLANVPSPNTYELVITKPGYATSVQPLDLGAGENRGGVALTLSKGDGQITGKVTDGSHGLAGVTVTATAGQAMTNSVTLSGGASSGRFTLRSLPTPATFTVVASAPGYTSQTLTVTLTQAQQLSGVSITLTRSAGSLSGRVTSVATVTGPQHPAPGVAVSATDGTSTVRTETAADGTWSLGDLPLPGTYTITFARSDLATQTVAIALDARGNVTPGSQGVTVAGKRVTVVMQPATGMLSGTVFQPKNTSCGRSGRVAEATVTLTAGSTTYSVTSAGAPAAACGQFRIAGIAPGTYTLTVSAGSGTSPQSQIVQITAGAPQTLAVALSQQASISGVLVHRAGPGSGAGPAAGWSVFLYASTDYPHGHPRVRQTDGSGFFTFPGVDAGDYVLAIGPTTDPTNAEQTTLVTVKPSEQHQLGKIVVAPQ